MLVAVLVLSVLLALVVVASAHVKTRKANFEHCGGCSPSARRVTLTVEDAVAVVVCVRLLEVMLELLVTVWEVSETVVVAVPSMKMAPGI